MGGWRVFRIGKNVPKIKGDVSRHVGAHRRKNIPFYIIFKVEPTCIYSSKKDLTDTKPVKSNVKRNQPSNISKSQNLRKSPVKSYAKRNEPSNFCKSPNLRKSRIDQDNNNKSANLRKSKFDPNKSPKKSQTKISLRAINLRREDQ